MKKVIVNLGARDIKIYEAIDQDVRLVEKIKIDFKKDFDIGFGLGRKHDEVLFELLEDLKDEFSQDEIIVYATALFSKMEEEVKDKYKESINELGITLEIDSIENPDHEQIKQLITILKDVKSLHKQKTLHER